MLLTYLALLASVHLVIPGHALVLPPPATLPPESSLGNDSFAGTAPPPVVWTDALALGVGGRPFPSNTGDLAFARWPAAAQADLSADEWRWGLASAGLFVQFSSNATAVHLNYTLRDANTTIFANFSPIGFSGCDLYAWDGSGNGRWRWVASVFGGLSGAGGHVLQSPLWANASGWPTPSAPSEPSQPWTTRYRLHLPSYNGVTAMAVGVPAGASLAPDTSWAAARAALYVGTSITQGGITSRPGATYVSRLSRALPAPVVNLGLCGACRLEPGLAKWVGAAGPPSALVVDCTANMSPSEVAANTPSFVRALRALGGGWAAVPIVLVEPLTYSPAWLLGDVLNRTGLRAELAAAYWSLVAAGDAALHYVPTAALESGTDLGEEFTYEGVHPMDRGHALIAAALEPLLAPLVREGLVAVPRAEAEAAVARASQLGASDAQPAVSSPAPPPASTAAAAARLGALRAADPPPADTVWTDASALGFTGRAFADTPSLFNRLPAAARGVVRDDVWALSLDSAGLGVSFVTDSPWVAINYTLADAAAAMLHFAASGVAGADLYAFDAAAGRYRFVAPVDPTFGAKTVAARATPPGVAVTPPGAPLRWLLNLPTYNAVTRLAVGTAPGFAAAAVDIPFVPRSPIVWYGTSILQGGVAERVGEIHSSRVARALGRPVFNFGFSGNGKMELDVGRFLFAIAPPPAAFIVDCSWNMDAASIAAAAVPFVRALRAANVSAPVWLAEGLPFGRNWAVPAEAQAQAASNAALAAAFALLRGDGDGRVYYMPTAALFSPDSVADSATAAGLHANDAGFHDMAAAWVDALIALAA